MLIDIDLNRTSPRTMRIVKVPRKCDNILTVCSESSNAVLQ